jgi:hypothetical protein
MATMDIRSGSSPAAGAAPVGGATLFREKQHMDQWWLRFLVLIPTAVAWWGFGQQIVLGRPFGTHPASNLEMVIIQVLVGVLLPIVVLGANLVVTVMPGRMDLRYFPFARRAVDLSTIAACEVRSYSPLGDYGGWGIRGYADDRVWSCRGNRGVQLVFRDGRKFLIGSSRPEELASAIRAASA